MGSESIRRATSSVSEGIRGAPENALAMGGREIDAGFDSFPAQEVTDGVTPVIYQAGVQHVC